MGSSASSSSACFPAPAFAASSSLPLVRSLGPDCRACKACQQECTHWLVCTDWSHGEVVVENAEENLEDENDGFYGVIQVKDLQEMHETDT